MKTNRKLNVVIKSVWYELRCYWCELLIEWALKVRPVDYTPSIIELVIDRDYVIKQLHDLSELENKVPKQARGA